MANYLLSVGMEVHAELNTASKMFCRCQVGFGGEPNTRICPVCIGLPGTLPVPNRHAIDLVLRMALALNCKIAPYSVFHRKNYFYPDLPKGYQVSQYGETNPIGYHGWLDVPLTSGGTKRVKIARVHLEEDTGKLLHLPSGGTGVDYNRAGVPLMEIVTAFPPDIESAEEARDYCNQLRQIMVYLGVCDGKLEEGSMRCEPNVSVRLEGAEKYGTKSEIKNLGSIRSVFLGVEFERKRQIAVLDGGGVVEQETRGWNDSNETSFAMRKKEAENDYRYFPDPDLCPMTFTDERIAEARAALPELPLAKKLRYVEVFGLSEYDAGVLTADRAWADFFETCTQAGGDPKSICNWLNGDFARLLNESGQSIDPKSGRELSKVTVNHLVELTKLIEKGTISGKIAKTIFEDMFTSGEMPAALVEKSGMTQIADTGAIEVFASEVIAENAGIVEKFKSGQENVMGFLVGQLMKKSQGRANPQLAQEILRKLIG